MVGQTKKREGVAGKARKDLASNLLRLRRARGLSQEGLAHEAGLHRTFVAHVERQSRNIALDNIERLADALEVDVYELLIPAGRGVDSPA